MKRLIFCLCLGLFGVSFAKNTHHHSEKSHAHGVAKLMMAFDGLKGKIQFESPAHSTVGFEYPAQSEAQKKQVASALETLKTKMGEMIVFNPELKCSWSQGTAKLDFDKSNSHSETGHLSSHSETVAEFDITCEKSPQGSKLSFYFYKTFPKLKKVDVEILVDDIQKSYQATKEATTLELK